jgi:hypothetical protein
MLKKALLYYYFILLLIRNLWLMFVSTVIFSKDYNFIFDSINSELLYFYSHLIENYWRLNLDSILFYSVNFGMIHYFILDKCWQNYLWQLQQPYYYAHLNMKACIKYCSITIIKDLQSFNIRLFYYHS